MLGTKEHCEVMRQFQKDFKLEPTPRLEHRSLWKSGFIYCHGATNNLFMAYRMGYAFGKAIGRESAEGKGE